MTSTDTTTGLVLRTDGTTIGELLDAAAQARTLADIVGDAQTALKRRLADEVKEARALAGATFNPKGEGELAGWRFELTDPDWKPHVQDRQAFEDWWVEQGFEHAERNVVEVVDHGALDDAIAEYRRLRNTSAPADLLPFADEMVAALEQAYEVLLPAAPLGRLTEPRFKATEAGFIDTDTGETVPGVVTNRAQPQPRVVGDPAAKAAMRAKLAARLGLTDQLEGGQR